jgi:hypothetical protein
MATQLDSDDKGTQEPASSEGSDSSSNQKSSTADYVSVAEFNKLQNQIETLRRSLQSEKDRGVKKVSERLDGLEGDLRTVLQNARQSGKSIEDVIADYDHQEEMEARQAVLELGKAFREGRFSAGQSGGSGSASGVDVQAVVSDLELDANDIRVKAFMAQSFTSQAEANLAAAKLLKSISKNQPSDADQVGQVARQQVQPEKAQQLQKEYDEGSKTLKGMALINFQRTMRRKGWNG